MNIDEYVKSIDFANSLLIDVRTKEEFDARHIPHSLNFPEEFINYFRCDKSMTLYLYCRTGRRSEKACEYLTQKGFKAINIGGILDYTGPADK